MCEQVAVTVIGKNDSGRCTPPMTTSRAWIPRPGRQSESVWSLLGWPLGEHGMIVA